MPKLFKDRTDAGIQLAKLLKKHKGKVDTIILALPRGGVPVAYEIANLLNLPLDVFIVRKIGFPGHEEFAIGAIADDDICILNNQALDHFKISSDIIQKTMSKEAKELLRRNVLYRQGRELPNLENKTVILVDDGIATGSSAKVAILALKRLLPKALILAVPVIPEDTLAEVTSLVDETVCLITPKPFYGVGSWYENFAQVNDDEVIELLNKTQRPK